MILPCIRCGFEPESAMPEVENAPYRATAFQSHGHYGSTVFDPMDGSFIELNVCDACLMVLQEKGWILSGRDRRLVMNEDRGVVGYERIRRPLKTWDGDGGPNLKDVRQVSDEAVGAPLENVEWHQR